jgi:hypothetical protein
MNIYIYIYIYIYHSIGLLHISKYRGSGEDLVVGKRILVKILSIDKDRNRIQLAYALPPGGTYMCLFDIYYIYIHTHVTKNVYI